MWIDAFEAGLESFRAQEFDSAAVMMNRIHQLRGESDGPAAFYLRKIAALEGREDQGDWDGTIELTEK